MRDGSRTTPRRPAWPFDPFARWRPPAPAPKLAPGEHIVTQTPLGRGDTAALTDRRVLVVGRDFERSLPLAHLALVHVRFERIVAEIVVGAIAILAALILFAAAAPVRAFFLGQAASLETAVAQERAAAGANPSEGEGQALPGQGQGLAQGLQKLVSAFAAAARALPLVAWLLLAFAAAKIALGVFGRTVVVFTAGGSELTFARRGRDRALREFITEVGGHLPPPARLAAPSSAAAPPPPTVPPNADGNR
jgi:hypothetical protein